MHTTKLILIDLGIRDLGKDKRKKSKGDQDKSENPNDLKDPSVEQKERLLATDEVIADEEDKEIAKKSTFPASRVSSFKGRCLRNLVCFDKSSKILVSPQLSYTLLGDFMYKPKPMSIEIILLFGHL